VFFYLIGNYYFYVVISYITQKCTLIPQDWGQGVDVFFLNTFSQKNMFKFVQKYITKNYDFNGIYGIMVHNCVFEVGLYEAY